MTARLPLLVIIPHGGRVVPEELENYTCLKEKDILLEGDTCALDIFQFHERVMATVASNISPLFIDPDRGIREISPLTDNGIIKIKTSSLRNIYNKKAYPDEIAIANMLKRYYYPFHSNIKRIMESKQVKMAIICHCITPVGTQMDPDTDQPRPLIHLQNIIDPYEREVKSCDDKLIKGLSAELIQNFRNEEKPVAGICKINDPIFKGYILKCYSGKGIPIIRLAISKSFFINDLYFNPSYLSVDSIRLNDLKERILKSIKGFFNNYNFS